MCILIHHPVNTKFAVEQLQDFYNKNPDGFGAIVKHGDTVKTVKSVGAIAEIIELYKAEVEGNEAIIHFRMKTHGEVNTDNCHPYEVVPGLWMAHNGVLSTGNDEDKSMSDTWHYIKNFIAPIIKQDKSMLFNPAFQALISDHIGRNNKFGFMDESGKIVIINKSSGITHKGVWYSNTYAWTPYKFGYGQPPVVYQPNNSYFNSIRHNSGAYASSPTWKQWNEYDKQTSSPFKNTVNKHPFPKDIQEETFEEIVSEYRYIIESHSTDDAFDYLAAEVELQPRLACRFLHETIGNERSKGYTSRDIAHMVATDPVNAAATIMGVWDALEDELVEISHEHYRNEFVTVDQMFSLNS